MVERLVVVVLYQVLPPLIQLVSGSTELGALLLETGVNGGNRFGRVLLQKVEDLLPVVAVDPRDGVHVRSRESALVKLVLVTVASCSGVLGGRVLAVGKIRGKKLLGRKDVDLVHEGLQNLEGALVRVNYHVNLESLVLASEQGLLVLILAHVAEGVGLLASDREGNPNVVEDVRLKGGTFGARGVRVVPRKGAVRRGALAAAREVYLGERDRVPRVVVNNLDGSRGGEDRLELHEKLVMLAEKILNELEHFRSAENLLGVHVEALQELRPSPTVSRGGGHDVTDLVKELALDTSVVDHGSGRMEGRIVGVAGLLALVQGLGHINNLLLPVAVVPILLPLPAVPPPSVLSSQGLLHVLLLAHVEIVLVAVHRVGTKVALSGLAAHL
mmetsp:Transcript_5488/g.10997  ORF Transcript_5488/g.10997 Transcript_5488/m.10997 type:complete len:386 (-) Transcript_5488:922-2079(-)